MGFQSVTDLKVIEWLMPFRGVKGVSGDFGCVPEALNRS